MEQLGIYGANYKLAVLMTLFVQMFKYAAEPFFFSKSGEKNAKKLYADVMIFFVVAGLFIFPAGESVSGLFYSVYWKKFQGRITYCSGYLNGQSGHGYLFQPFYLV